MSEPQTQSFVALPANAFFGTLDVNMRPLPPIDFYLKVGERFELLRKADQPYSPLALSVHEIVWIRDVDFDQVRKEAEAFLNDPKLAKIVPVPVRAELLKRSAMKVVDDLFRDPSPQNIERGMKTVGSLVYLMMREPESYQLLSQLSEHDPYTLRHSVGTAVHCIIIARKHGIHDETALNEAGLAGLLHDIGKVRVKPEIINKQGPLDELEWQEMRQHPQLGYEILKDNPAIGERVKRAVLEHHEDKLGTGYPGGKRYEDLELYSKIVTISDIFHALTSDRTYSKARSPFDAFQLMHEKLTHKIDEALFRDLVLIYGGKAS